jgi:ribosomal-protein-alanine N-acetyltransferase
MAAPTITTARLRLRNWRDADLEAYASMNADQRVMEFYLNTLDHAESDASARRAQAFLDERGFGLWAVEELGGAPFIGYVGLDEPKFEAHFTPCIEIGWRLSFAHWGYGYASEAASVVLAHAFDGLGIPEVVSFTAANNLRSRRVMERLGMRQSRNEDFEHPSIPHGHPLRRHVLYRATKSSKRTD